MTKDSPCDGYGNPRKPKKTVYDVITEHIITSLEAGTVPWRKPWKSGAAGTPRNFVTGHCYRGINLFMTALQSYARQEWLTFKQISKIPMAKIKEGERATPILFWMTKTIDDPKAPKGKRTIFSARYYRVWNVEQVEGLPEPEETKEPERVVNPIDEAEKVIVGYKSPPSVSHGHGFACYIPAADEIKLPDMKAFDSDQEYYSTMFHEMTHSTGHESRVSREGITESHRFGDAVYSKEELVAEMGAAFLCGHTGIEAATIENSASYVDGWLKKIRGDSKLVIQAASRAQKAVDFILGRKFDKDSDE